MPTPLFLKHAMNRLLFLTIACIVVANLSIADEPADDLQRPDVTYKIFQFPADKIPRIDGLADDWEIVPDDYRIGMRDHRETDKKLGDKFDPKNLDVSIKVGWVKGMPYLYFLYEAFDNYWDFERPDLHNDIFEVVVDGDLSGGPFIRQMHPIHKLRERLETHSMFHGVHAQNYHIFTPAVGKDWAMVWGSQPWIKDLPHANAATKFDFKHGDSGKLTLEFWITPFDYAPPQAERAVASQLNVDKLIGLSWAILDYDEPGDGKNVFWNLSHKTTMYGNASDLVAFRLMPLEPSLQKTLDCNWSFHILDAPSRRVAFHDDSVGKVTKWLWEFGDGTTSEAQSPIHTYKKPGEFVVVLTIEGPTGKARRAKVWDVTLP